MSPSPQLSPPGSSTYNSDTMHVGDGTWDAGRDDFLLPNLVGFNFMTMRYNGMGNRFFTMTGYHSVVEAHAIVAAITFLFIIPTAILLRRFGGRTPQLARQLHIWLQILALLLVTVVITLGAFAVGPSRALTNPHHGVGVAIYVLIWVQVMLGCLSYRSEKRKKYLHIPLRAMLHHWLGRAIALLGIAQVALGLTVYGSPLSLFVLYALWVFMLLVTYFVLQYLADKHRSRAGPGSSRSSYFSDDVSRPPPQRRQGSGLGGLAMAGAAGAGLAALFRRRSSGGRPAGPADSEYTGTESRTSYMYDEKHSNAPPRTSGWGRRLLEVGAIGGGLAAARRMFTRRQVNDNDSDAGPYRPPLGGNQSITTADTVSRIEEGRPPIRPTTPTGPPTGAGFGQGRPPHPLAQPPMTPGSGRRHSDDSSYYDYMSNSPSRRGRHQTFREALAAGGTAFAVRQFLRNRRQRKEERRAEDLRKQRVEQENLTRMDSVHRHTADDLPPPRRMRHDRLNSQTASDVSSFVDGSVHHGGTGSALPLAGAGAAVAAASALADRDRVRPVGADPTIAPPGPPSALPPPPHMIPSAPAPPPPPPLHNVDPQSSGSELYTTASGRQRHRHHLANEAAAGVLGAAAGAATGALAAESSRRRRSGQNTDSMESAPVSLKVKMHNDGRHVTLRRLTEEEAAAQREARRRERQSSAATRRRRDSSLGSSSDEEMPGAGANTDRRWRRTEMTEAQQAAEIARPPPPPAHAPSTSISPMPAASTSGPIYPPPAAPGTGDAAAYHPYQLPGPPPIPGSSSNLGRVTSPGTETSGATEYANNRRRRRAERAQARLAREGRPGQSSVDFT